MWHIGKETDHEKALAPSVGAVPDAFGLRRPGGCTPTVLTFSDLALPGDSVTAVTVTYAGKTVTCTDPAQVRAMTDAARSLEFVPTDASVTTPGAMSMELTFTDSSGSAVTLTLPLTQSGGKVYDAGADSIGIFAEILGE